MSYYHTLLRGGRGWLGKRQDGLGPKGTSSPDRPKVFDHPELSSPQQELVSSLYEKRLKESTCAPKKEIEVLYRLAHENQAGFTEKFQNVFRMSRGAIKNMYIGTIEKMLEGLQNEDMLRELSKARSLRDIDSVVNQLEDQHVACLLKDICITYFFNLPRHDIGRYTYPVALEQSQLKQNFVDLMRGQNLAKDTQFTPDFGNELVAHIKKRIWNITKWRDQCKKMSESLASLNVYPGWDAQVSRSVHLYVLAYALCEQEACTCSHEE